mmetsp:Transcript_24672/g.53220  ORF Transcript_24672/g.53220 Transcript_24672/m.53220 type:complete len:210 (-) Transcript_24672:998-1627(-)
MSRNDMREIESTRYTIHPLQRLLRLSIQYQFRQYGRTEQFAILRNGNKVGNIGVIVVPRPRIQRPARNGPLAQRFHRRVNFRRFLNRSPERHDVNLRREEHESELDHASPSLLSRRHIVHDDIFDRIACVEQQRSWIFLYHLGRILRHAADAIRHDQRFGRFMEECRFAVRTHGLKLQRSQRLVINVHEPFWHGKFLCPVSVSPLGNGL